MAGKMPDVCDPKVQVEDSKMKASSRLNHECQWCNKQEDASKERFKKCGNCKEVIYCSRNCQTKAWPYHKTNCKNNVELKKNLGAIGGNEALSGVAHFQKWHIKQTNAIHHAVLCALDLAEHPENADRNVVLLSFSPRQYAASEKAEQPYLSSKMYRLESGYTMSIPEALAMTAQAYDVEAIFENARRVHVEAKRRNRLGMVLVIMTCGPICDMAQIGLTSRQLARISIQHSDWRNDWEEKLRGVLENEVEVPDPYFGLMRPGKK